MEDPCMLSGINLGKARLQNNDERCRTMKERGSRVLKGLENNFIS